MSNVKRVTRTEANLRLFRQVSRESCGETCSPPDNDRLLFCYDNSCHGDKGVVGVACYQAARLQNKQPSRESFLDNFYHQITYVFVRSYNKGQGIGSKMLQFMFKEMRIHAKRPVRLQSAEKATRFFERHQFVVTGEVVDCVCGGSPLFSRLVNMERNLT